MAGGVCVGGVHVPPGAGLGLRDRCVGGSGVGEGGGPCAEGRGRTERARDGGRDKVGKGGTVGGTERATKGRTERRRDGWANGGKEVRHGEMGFRRHAHARECILLQLRYIIINLYDTQIPWEADSRQDRADIIYIYIYIIHVTPAEGGFEAVD